MASRASATWTTLGPFSLAILAAGLGLVVAAQRHLFDSPGLALVPLLLAVVVEVTLGTGVLDKPPGRAGRVVLAVASVDVIAATYWLVIGFPDHRSDAAPFFLVILIVAQTVDAGSRYGLALVAANLGGAVVFDLAGHYPFGSWALWGFAYAISWLGGASLRWQVLLTRQLEAAQAELGRRAAEEERRRLAREVHDLIAHSLAVSMLHMTGARLALQAGENEEALEALEEAEEAGRAAMSEIHRTVGLLGPSATDGGLAPTPSAADLPALVESFAAAGLVLESTLEGDLASVPMTEGLAAYRIVQESLANAVKHAPGAPVRLHVRVVAGRIEIEVANPREGIAPAKVSTGSGVRGMTERAEMLRGSFSSGSSGGEWTVTAVIPLASP